MGSIPVANPVPRRRSRATRRGVVVVAVVAVAVIAVLAGIRVATWSPLGWVDVGRLDEIPVNSPERFAEYSFWLVKLESGEVLALYQADPHLGCTVPWHPTFQFQGRTGWFRNPCHAQTYDLTGRCFDGPCIRRMDRFPVRVEGGRVEVNVTAEPIEGPPIDMSAEPVTP